MLKDKIIKNNKKRGFTLIEMMVAVSIFVIVAFIVVSALLTMSYAYKKSLGMRLLMDNFNFSLQSMSLNIREGVKYHLPSPGCNLGDDKYSCIQFEPVDSWLTGLNSRTCYSFLDEEGKGSVRRCEGGTCPCSNNSSRLTSPDIDVDMLIFSFFDNNGHQREAVKIMISGTAKTNARDETSFFIQNTVSQRSASE
jgi:prepilin-type N-terminal cleavage/methylation domain-containing protein